MKIVILDSSVNAESRLLQFIDKLNIQLKEQNNHVDLFRLQEMDLKYCIGCWSCWWKTPGKCIHKDDGEAIFRAVTNADFVIFASPMIAGFTSALLKKITDRLIVLLHPYIKIRDKECHHRKRYDKYPKFGVLVEKEPTTDTEDIAITKAIYERFAINFHSQIIYFECIESSKIETIVYETANN